MAIGTWALVIGTIYYLRKTFKISSITIERPQILEFLGEIIPIMQNLVKVSGSLKKKEFHWIHSQMRPRDIKQIEVPLFLYLQRDKYARFVKGIESYNILVSILIDGLKRIDEEIYTSDFGKECFKSVEAFNKQSSEKEKIPPDRLPDPPSRIVGYIMDNVKELPKESPYYHFWRKYSEQFLNKRKDVEVKASISTLYYVFVDRLAKWSKELSDIFDVMFERLMKEYNITLKEVQERIKESEGV